jgi:protein adenylyltransferase
LFAEAETFRNWAVAWRARLAAESLTPAARAVAMRQVNPAFIPRNHRVEEAIAAATVGDLAPFEALTAVLERPFDDQPAFAHLAVPPGVEHRGYRTFCGT